MFQSAVTMCANQAEVVEWVRNLEREEIVKIHEHTPLTLILDIPDDRNDESVITALAKFARKGLVTDFRSSWIK